MGVWTASRIHPIERSEKEPFLFRRGVHAETPGRERLEGRYEMRLAAE